MNWLLGSVVTALLFAFGITLTNFTIRSGLPLQTTFVIFGLVWIVSSLATHRTSIQLTWITVLAACVAGLLFYFGNLEQFKAMQAAPLTAYPMLVITAVSAVVVTVFDIIRLLRAGTLKAPSLHEVGAVIFTIAAIVLFSYAPKH